MHFLKYQSLENSYRELPVEWALINTPKTAQWVVTEKLHGANFAFYLNLQNGEIKTASRNQFVQPEEFYSCKEVVEALADKLNTLAASFNNKYVEYVVVYGELFGPGIQQGVQYGEKSFRAFDIKLVTEEYPEGTYLTYKESKLCLGPAGIEMVPELFIGTFKEALEFQNDMDSLVLDVSDNVMEGTVIKSYSENFYNQFGGRIVFKNKNSKFSEKQKAPKVKVPVAPQKNGDDIVSYINSNRVHAVVSKLGNITPKDFGKVIGMFSKDVIEDCIADGVIPVDFKSNDDFKYVGKFITTQSKQLLIDEVLSKI